MAERDALRMQVRKVLLEDWDPAGAQRFEAAHGEYDSCIDPLLELIRAGDEQALIDFLHERECESMCFPSLDTRRLRPVARKLLRLAAAQ